MDLDMTLQYLEHHFHLVNLETLALSIRRAIWKLVQNFNMKNIKWIILSMIIVIIIILLAVFIDGKKVVEATIDSWTSTCKNWFYLTPGNYNVRLTAKNSGGENGPNVIIAADGKAPHQSVMLVMEAARNANLPNVVFATQSKSK